MCGIAGYLLLRGEPRAREQALASMSAAMIARGPDGAGHWTAEAGAVGLAHRRLSIIAPGPDGAQPMESVDGESAITYNGEIYNFRELRAELAAKGHRFASDGSDTETILAVYAQWGVAGFARLRGMYAFAIWDAHQRQLVLARDPYGIKPLYLSRRSDGVTFASQVRALATDPSLDKGIDPAALAGFAIWGSVPEPFSIYRAVEAVPAGSWMTFSLDGASACGTIDDIADILARHEDDPRGNAVQALRDSMAAHLVADVEVGCFLSAGVDSSAIAGMMRDRAQGGIRAITLAFDEYAGTPADEAPLAALAARQYGIAHHVDRIQANDFNDSLPRIVADMDQPSVDGVNTWLVSRAAHRAGLKVALSGLGGDELLAGYSTFKTVPRSLAAGRALGVIPGGRALAAMALGRSGQTKAALAPRYTRSLAQTYLLRRSMLLPEQLDQVLPPELARAGLDRLDPVNRLEQTLVGGPRGQTAQIALLEATQYMRNQLLRDSDWAGMAHSLEIRVPLVDVVLLAALAPYQRTFAMAGTGKRLLANAPTTPLPAVIVDRRKTGFQVPVNAWIAADGRAIAKGSAAWAKSILDRYLSDASLSL